VTVKIFIDVKISISNKCCSFELSISSRNPENSFKNKQTNKQKKTNVFSIDNNKKCFLTTKSAY